MFAVRNFRKIISDCAEDGHARMDKVPLGRAGAMPIQKPFAKVWS